MKLSIACAAVAGFAMLVSCTPQSLEPYYTRESEILDSGLPGVWANTEDGSTMRFAPSERGYDAIYNSDRGEPARFHTVLFVLGKTRYLDMFPEVSTRNRNELAELTYVPAHIVFRISRDRDVMRVAVFDGMWLRSKLEEKGSTLSYTVVEGTPVLTAPTSQIQRFLAEYGDEPGAFSEWSEWHRQVIGKF